MSLTSSATTHCVWRALVLVFSLSRCSSIMISHAYCSCSLCTSFMWHRFRLRSWFVFGLVMTYARGMSYFLFTTAGSFIWVVVDHVHSRHVVVLICAVIYLKLSLADFLVVYGYTETLPESRVRYIIVLETNPSGRFRLFRTLFFTVCILRSYHAIMDNDDMMSSVQSSSCWQNYDKLSKCQSLLPMTFLCMLCSDISCFVRSITASFMFNVSHEWEFRMEIDHYQICQIFQEDHICSWYLPSTCGGCHRKTALLVAAVVGMIDICCHLFIHRSIRSDLQNTLSWLSWFALFISANNCSSIFS